MLTLLLLLLLPRRRRGREKLSERVCGREENTVIKLTFNEYLVPSLYIGIFIYVSLHVPSLFFTVINKISQFTVGLVLYFMFRLVFCTWSFVLIGCSVGDRRSSLSLTRKLYINELVGVAHRSRLRSFGVHRNYFHCHDRYLKDAIFGNTENWVNLNQLLLWHFKNMCATGKYKSHQNGFR